MMNFGLFHFLSMYKIGMMSFSPSLFEYDYLMDSWKESVAATGIVSTNSSTWITL